MGRLLILLCALAGAAGATEAPPAPPRIPIEEFTKFDEFGEIKISPDGQHLALTTGRYGRGALAFIDLKTQKITGATRVQDPLEIDDFHWVSNETVIFTIAQRFAGRATPSATGEIYAIDAVGGTSHLIYGFRAGEMTTGTRLPTKGASYASAELVSVLKDDPKTILIAEYPWKEGIAGWWRDDPDAHPKVVLLDVYSGKKKTIDVSPLRGGGVLVDRSDQVRFAVGRSGASTLSVSWRPEAGAQWTDFDLPGLREGSVMPREFSSDNRSVYLTGVAEGETLSSLFRLDLQTHKLEKIQTFEGVAVSGLIRDFAGHEIVGVRGYGDKPVYAWLAKDDPAAKLYVALQRAFPNQDVTITSTSDDGRLAIAFVSSDTNPGDFYLFDTATKRADYLRSARAWVDPKQMRPKESIRVTTRDGATIQGYLTRAAGEGPAPMVVLPHGGPHGYRDVWSYDWEVQLLANRGYSVLQVNFRGSDGFGIEFESAGYRQWGARMQDDLTDATRWAIEQKIAPADRICIFGASYGGYAALMGAVREPNLYRCAIGYAGVYDLELLQQTGDMDSRAGRAYLDEVLGTDAADLRARSPAHNANRIEVPVLLIHGKDDSVADYEQAKRMKSALEKNGKKLEWMALSHEGHGAYNEATRREVYERVLEFLDRHLQPALSASQ